MRSDRRGPLLPRYKLPAREPWPLPGDDSPAAQHFRACDATATKVERLYRRAGAVEADHGPHHPFALALWGLAEAGDAAGPHHPYGAPLLTSAASLRALYAPGAPTDPETVLRLFAAEVSASRSRSRGPERRALLTLCADPAQTPRGVVERFLRATEAEAEGPIPSVALAGRSSLG